jgi:L,D-transpeptidase ErfK/SrfK
MRRIDILPLKCNWLHLISLCICIVSLNGCAVMRNVEEKEWLPAGHLQKTLEGNDFSVAKGDDVIGGLAVIRVEKGDTLPDIARHFSLGINAISAANPGVDVWAPVAGERITLPLNFILPDSPRKGIVVNLATMRLFQYKAAGKSLLVATYPVGVGTKERPTPIGQMHVQRKAAGPTWHVPASISEDHRKKGDPLPAEIPPGPWNPLGDYALYLSKSGYLIHGTNKPASIGLNATNGCMRLYPENIKKLFNETPVNTPVVIVNQPYLTGQRNGVVYLEAHKSLDDTGTGAIELEKLYAKLANLESKLGRTLDWRKIKAVLAEARGIPVPVCQMKPGTRPEAAKAVEVEHPQKLYGKPEVSELKKEGWYVLAADMGDEVDASRLAAIINHQGPQIPARVLSESNSHHVIAGPFTDISEAKTAAKRLKIDLAIDGILFEPGRKNL